MDRRSWPWKRRSSDKAAVDKVAAILDSADTTLALTRPKSEQENYKKPTYVQISVESYSHLTGLEDQVKTYEEQVQTYEEQVQTLEDKVKELNQKLEDKDKELDEKISEAESEMTDKEILVKQHAKVAEEAVSGWEKAEAEALALKDHLETVTLEKLSIEDRASHLDGALKECMKQIRNLKEEHDRNLHEVIHTMTKQCEKIQHEFEAKIVNLNHELKKSASDNAALSRTLQERSNMLVNISEEKSNAEAQIEILKSNIESCEREIQSLKYELHVAAKELEIRTEEKNMSVKSADVATKQQLEGAKKISKLEAEVQRLRGLVRKKLPGPAALAQMKLEVENLGYGESSFRRSPAKSPVHRFSSGPEFSVDALQKFQRESEFLTERLLATEEETKMLKEALSKRNSELQASRSICAKTNSRVQMLEAQLHISTPSIQSHHSPSLTSMSEDNDDDRSYAESYVATSVSEFSPFLKDRSSLKTKKANSPIQLDLMDDFLEMEKLACGPASNPDADPLVKPDAANVVEASSRLLPLSDLRSRIIAIFDSEDDVDKALEDIKQAVLDVCRNLQCGSENCVSDKTPTDDVNMSQDEVAEANQTMSKDLETAILQIHDFVLFLGKEAMSVQDISIDTCELDHTINAFLVTYKRVLSDGPCWDSFLIDLSCVLSKTSELKFNFLGYKESKVNVADCIDKVVLPDNKESGSSPSSISDVTSHPEASDDGNIEFGGEESVVQNAISSEEYEKLVQEKDEMEKLLSESTDNLENLKTQMQETEKLLSEIQSQLASAQRSKSLGETQLKCMAESYRTLEVRAEELESEVNLLRAKTETLESELLEEKKHHHEALNRCEDLQEQLQRLEDDVQKSNADVGNNQDTELTAAAEKLAECQETIFLLGKQLNSLRPPQLINSPKSESLVHNDYNYRHDFDRAETDTTYHRLGSESPMDLYNFPRSPTETELSIPRTSPLGSRNTKHRSTLSGSSSSSATPEKHSRGFSRFFSSKGKNGQ